MNNISFIGTRPKPFSGNVWEKLEAPYNPDAAVKTALELASAGDYALLEDMLLEGDEYEESERLCQAVKLFEQGCTYGPILAQLALEKWQHFKTHPNTACTALLAEIDEIGQMAKKEYRNTNNKMPKTYELLFDRLKEALLCWQVYNNYLGKSVSKSPISINEHFEIANQIVNHLNLVSEAAAIYKKALSSCQSDPIHRGHVLKACYYLTANKDYSAALAVFKETPGSKATAAEILKVVIPIFFKLKQWRSVCDFYSKLNLYTRTRKDLFMQAHSLLMQQQYDQAASIYYDIRNGYEDRMDIPPGVVIGSACAIVGSTNIIDKLRKRLETWNSLWDARENSDLLSSEESDNSDNDSNLEGSGPLRPNFFYEEDELEPEPRTLDS